MDVLRNIAGMVELEAVSAELESTLRVLNAEGIEIFDYQPVNQLTGRFRIRQKDLKRTERIFHYLEGTIRILKKHGVYWALRSAFIRPVLMIGMAGIFVFYLFIPSRVFFVKVEGNRTIPSSRILLEAEAAGVFFGASRKEIRSEKVKNTLLERIPQLQWAGVNTEGCVATISVRERQRNTEQSENGGFSSLAASRDGYILSATATRGTLLVQPGASVRKGQLLISGYTDCGLCIRAEQAEGEVYAQTNRKLTLLMPAIRDEYRNLGKSRKKISLLLGKKRINLWKDSGISVGTCGRMYEEYYITLPGGFLLPAALCVETFPQYQKIPALSSPEEIGDRLAVAAQEYLKQQMTAGTILKSSETVLPIGNAFLFTGNYVCRELISGVRVEQIGEINGENN